MGHSSFLINSAEKSILLNPFKAIGCASNLKEPKEVNADFILASSRLLDEGYNPNDQLMFVEPGIYQFEDILLNGISIPHDRVDGRRFGLATVWSWEQNNLKIVHMGGAAGDIDFNSQIFDFKYKNLDFTVPHKKLSYRNFVLIPLKEILPNWIHPKTKDSIDKLLDKLPIEDKNSILKIIKS